MSDAGVTRIKRPQSLTALVAEQIRDMIVTERFALGELLSENIIAALLGVSRAPVRDAFVRLETEGLVKVQPQRGTFVFQYDATELREICELRQVLETGALRIATACHRAGLIEALRRPIEAAEREGELDPKAYQPFDTAFHDGLVRSSGNNELMDAYGRISGRVRAIRHRLTRLSAHVGNCSGCIAPSCKRSRISGTMRRRRPWWSTSMPAIGGCWRRREHRSRSRQRMRCRLVRRDEEREASPTEAPRHGG